MTSEQAASPCIIDIYAPWLTISLDLDNVYNACDMFHFIFSLGRSNWLSIPVIPVHITSAFCFSHEQNLQW